MKSQAEFRTIRLAPSGAEAHGHAATRTWSVWRYVDSRYLRVGELSLCGPYWHARHDADGREEVARFRHRGLDRAVIAMFGGASAPAHPGGEP